MVHARLPPPSNLVFGHCSQTARKRFNLWEDVERASVAMMERCGWSPGNTHEEGGMIALAREDSDQIRVKLVGVLNLVPEYVRGCGGADVWLAGGSN